MSSQKQHLYCNTEKKLIRMSSQNILMISCLVLSLNMFSYKLKQMVKMFHYRRKVNGWVFEVGEAIAMRFICCYLILSCCLILRMGSIHYSPWPGKQKTGNLQLQLGAEPVPTLESGAWFWLEHLVVQQVYWPKEEQN